MFSKFFGPFDLTAEDTGFDFSNIIPSIKSDIQDLGDKYKIEMDLPGFTKDQVDIKLENGTLLVSATKETSEDTKEKTYICKERTSSSVKRQFKLGRNVNIEDISAKMENGVLTIDVNKKELPKEETTITIE